MPENFDKYHAWPLTYIIVMLNTPSDKMSTGGIWGC